MGAYKLFARYFIFFYIIPALGLVTFYQDYLDLFNIDGNFWPLVIIPIILLLVYSFDILLPKTKLKRNLMGSMLFHDYFLLSLAVVFLITSLYFFQNFSMSFRHKESMSESGVLIIMMFGLRALYKVIILYYLFIALAGSAINIIQNLVLTLVIISYILSINSSFDALFIFVAIIVIFKKVNILITSDLSNPSKSILSISLAFIVIVIVVFVGIANKIGIDTTYILFSDIGLLRDIFVYLLKRLSTHFVSILTAGENYYRDKIIISDLLESQLSNLFSRFTILFGGLSIPKPDIWSVNRLNYLRLFLITENPKTGSSPGILASVFYSPSLLSGLIAVSIFIVIVLRKFSELFNILGNIKLNHFGYFILIFFLMSLFESPFDLINILSPSFIFFFFFLFIPTKMK